MKAIRCFTKSLLLNAIRYDSARKPIHTCSETLRSIREALQAGPKHDVTVEGWVRSVRKYKDVVFIHITDGTTVQPLQLVLPPEILDSAASYDSSVRAMGELQTSQGSGQHLELKATSLTVIGKCPSDVMPLKARKQHPPDYLRQFLHLRPRATSFTSLLRIRNAATQAMHRYFQENDFCQIHTPVLTTNDCEGAGEIFQVQPSSEVVQSDGDGESLRGYFNNPAYLTVSGQLHLEAMASALRNVYTFGPTFRAENSQSRHHLCEFYMVEAEMAFTAGLEDIMQVVEDLMKYTTRELCEHHSDDLRRLMGSGLDEEKSIRNINHRQYHRMTYTEAVDILEAHNSTFQFPVKWGCDLQKEHERFLVHHCGSTPVFVTDFPTDIKPFYAKKNDDHKTVAAVDLLCEGVGEVCGGSLRVDDYDTLRQVLEKNNISDKYDWYLDLRKFGSVPHGGFGLGFERYLQTLLGIQNIKDTIPFPRSTRNCRL